MISPTCSTLQSHSLPLTCRSCWSGTRVLALSNTASSSCTTTMSPWKQRFWFLMPSMRMSRGSPYGDTLVRDASAGRASERPRTYGDRHVGLAVVVGIDSQFADAQQMLCLAGRHLLVAQILVELLLLDAPRPALPHHRRRSAWL
jgi:hypothetical protein